MNTSHLFNIHIFLSLFNIRISHRINIIFMIFHSLFNIHIFLMNIEHKSNIFHIFIMHKIIFQRSNVFKHFPGIRMCKSNFL